MHDLFIGLHIGNTANRLLLLSKRSLSAHLKPEIVQLCVCPILSGFNSDPCMLFSPLSVERKHCFILQKSNFLNDVMTLLALS